MIIVVVSGLLIAAILFLTLRNRGYRRQVSFTPRYDAAYDFSEYNGTTIKIAIQANGFVLPAHAQYDTAVLEICVSTDILGRTIDPQLDLHAADRHASIFFERGAEGRRYLNISNVLGAAGPVKMHGHH